MKLKYTIQWDYAVSSYGSDHVVHKVDTATYLEIIVETLLTSIDHIHSVNNIDVVSLYLKFQNKNYHGS